MISGFSDVSMIPKTNYFCVETSGYFKISKNISNHLKIKNGKHEKSGIGFVENIGKDVGRTIPKTRLDFFEILEYGINIFQKS